MKSLVLIHSKNLPVVALTLFGNLLRMLHEFSER